MISMEPKLGSDRSRRFEFSERGRHWEVQARSLQVHETVDLYGRAIALPRYALRQRLLWSLLLGLARFNWGQALIRRLTSRRPDR